MEKQVQNALRVVAHRLCAEKRDLGELVDYCRKLQKQHHRKVWWTTWLVVFIATAIYTVVPLGWSEVLVGANDEYEITPAGVDHKAEQLSDYRPYLLLEDETAQRPELKFQFIPANASMRRQLHIEEDRNYTLDLVILAHEGTQGWPLLTFQVPQALSKNPGADQRLVVTEAIGQETWAIAPTELLSTHNQKITNVRVEKTIDIASREELLKYGATFGWGDEKADTINTAGCDRMQRYRITFTAAAPEYLITLRSKVEVEKLMIRLAALAVIVASLIATGILFLRKDLELTDVSKAVLIYLFPNNKTAQMEPDAVAFSESFMQLMEKHKDDDGEVTLTLEEELVQLCEQYPFPSDDASDNT